MIPTSRTPFSPRRLLLPMLLILSLLISAAALAADHRPSRQPPEKRPLAEVAPYRRLLWVARWDYHTPKDVERIMYQAAQARFSDVLFQVRGEGTVSFRSNVEPWAWELGEGDVNSTGRDPGWDPLAKALAEGHRYGLRVHAYLNALPGWGQVLKAPASSGQIYTTHRTWFLQDGFGRLMDPMRLHGIPKYAFLDPANLAVRKHLAALAGDLARRYAIDGIHLDYIRYPFECGDYSHTPTADRAFRERYGVSPRRRPRQWDEFRREQVTAVVRDMAAAARAARPGIEMSAAILADGDDRYNKAAQDAETWLQEGLLDAVVPMAYTGQMGRFSEFTSEFSGQQWRGKVWLGLWADTSRNQELLLQARRTVRSGFSGVAVFSYKELFPMQIVTRRVVDLYYLFVGKTL